MFGLVYADKPPTGYDKIISEPTGLSLFNHNLYPPAMAQVTQEDAASSESLQPTRSFLRSITLIASCTAAMIVNVSLTSKPPRTQTTDQNQRLRQTRPQQLPFRQSVRTFRSPLTSCNGLFLRSPLAPAAFFSSSAALQIFTAERRLSCLGP